jgi:hypothetical protein
MHKYIHNYKQKKYIQLVTAGTGCHKYLSLHARRPHLENPLLPYALQSLGESKQEWVQAWGKESVRGRSGLLGKAQNSSFPARKH